MSTTTASSPERVAVFERLYKAHYCEVAAYVRRRATPTDVDDVVAEVFLIAWRRLEVIGGTPTPWLYETARRVLANRRRATNRHAAMIARVASHASLHGPQPTERGGRLAAAFRTLSAADRDALALVAWEGLSTAAAAEASGCSHAAMRVRLHRARRRLRRALDAQPAPEARLNMLREGNS